MYDGVAVDKILAEKHDSTIIPCDIILEIQYSGVVTCDTIVENITKMCFWALIPDFSAVLSFLLMFSSQTHFCTFFVTTVSKT